MEKNLNSLGTLLIQSATGSNLAGNLPQTEKTVLSKHVDLDQTRIERSILATENGQTIRAMIRENETEAGTALFLEVKYCAMTYCASPNTEPETIKEATRFVISQYSTLAFHEIREAFRLAAAGKIEASLAAYHGQFAVRILGEVLSAYDDYRTQVGRELRARLREQEDEGENQQRATILREIFGTLSEQYQALTQENRKYQRWQDLPDWFCSKLVREDIPRFALDEKSKTWIIAKHWAVNQVGTWLLTPALSKEERTRYREAKQVIEKDPEAFPDELRKEAESAYCKMLVFNQIAPFEQ